jgi:probable HAF family extracellular repeat protein
MVNLGTILGGSWTQALAVSADGLVVAGRGGFDSSGASHAFRWTIPGGMQDLGTLPGGGQSGAWGVSADGTVIVGNNNITESDEHAFRWTLGEGMMDLGTLPGDLNSDARGVNGDGSVVVGYSYPSAYSTDSRAFRWTTAQGMVNLNTYLATLGIDLTGWTLTEARGVSADGLTITGNGVNPDGHPEAWIVYLSHVPCPADFNGDGSLAVSDIFAFLNAWFADDHRADFNRANCLTVQDIFDFLNAWFAGCP